MNHNNYNQKIILTRAFIDNRIISIITSDYAVNNAVIENCTPNIGYCPFKS
jgi:hypothetical protein